MEPTSIINDILIPAMRQVGELFGRGELLLPFVLQSAEVMKRSVDRLEPLMETADAASTVKILLATVAGDVHNIGKNLVDIILLIYRFWRFDTMRYICTQCGYIYDSAVGDQEEMDAETQEQLKALGYL